MAGKLAIRNLKCSGRAGVVVAIVAAGLSLAACAASRALHSAVDHDVVYWCPMHPDVRGRRGDKCPLCAMQLVPASAADYRPYTLDFDVIPRALRAGETGKVKFRVLEPATGRLVKRFELLHERIFHLFIVSHDLAYFAHVHPMPRSDGSLELDINLPQPGPYRLIADFLPVGGAPQLIEKSFVTAGYLGPIGPSTPTLVDVDDELVDGARVKLITPPSVAGREQLVTFELSDRQTGRLLEDLEPYLGATGHLLVVSSDLGVSFHSHPVAEVSSRFGPTVVFQMVFGRPGTYRMWMQFQRQGKVGTASFAIPVAARQ